MFHSGSENSTSAAIVTSQTAAAAHPEPAARPCTVQRREFQHRAQHHKSKDRGKASRISTAFFAVLRTVGITTQTEHAIPSEIALISGSQPASMISADR